MHTDVEPAMTVRDVASFLNVDEKNDLQARPKRRPSGLQGLGVLALPTARS